MTDTLTIDPARTAVLSMDCQLGIVSIYTREAKDAFLARVASVLKHARSTGMTIIHIRVGFRPGFPEISSRNALFGAIASPHSNTSNYSANRWERSRMPSHPKSMRSLSPSTESVLSRARISL